MTVAELMAILASKKPTDEVVVITNEETTCGFCDCAHGIEEVEQRDHGVALLSFQKVEADKLYNRGQKYFRVEPYL